MNDAGQASQVAGANSSPTFQLAGAQGATLRLDLLGRSLLAGERRIALTEKETRLAAILFRHAGVPVAKVLLHEQVYGEQPVQGSRCLDVLAGRLRKKLLAAGALYRIVSVRKLGYKLLPQALRR